MVNNRLVLTGKICKSPRRKVSPAGIPHCQFWLAHQSEREEAGLMRKVWCTLPVIASGTELHALTQVITLGSRIKVIGFLCQQQNRQGITQLILHAEQIELLNSGE